MLLFSGMNYVFVGLGNPGEEYENTRHNTGRMILDVFRKKQELPEWEFDKKSNALVSSGKVGRSKVTILLPETFMNKSGNAVAKFVKSKKAAETLVVVHDDLDLPLGRFKISFNKSSGGHRGVESIMRAVGTEGFVRIRVGISKAMAKGKVKKPHGEKEVGDFILGKFKPAEEKDFKSMAKKVAEALEMIATEGRESATQKFNSL